MERLTQKDDFFDYVLPEQNIFGDNQAFEISLGKTEYTCKLHITGEAIKRFGELEDVMEKYGIKNAEELDNLINSIRTNTLIDIENKEILELENANLKSKLAELKRKAIVPKFSLGQEVWAISVYRKDCVDNFTIQEICFCSRYGLYYKTNMGINLYEYYFDIFATREEAEQKLAKLKGE